MHTFSYQFRYQIPQPLVTPNPSNGRGSGLTRGLIRAYLSGRHSLCPTLSHVKAQKQGLRKRTLIKTGRTARNLHPNSYGVFSHQRDQSFFCTPSFLALTREKVGMRLRVYPPSKHSLCLTLSHIETWKQGLRKQTVSKTGRTMRNLRPGGYGAFAHQCDQSFFPHPRLFRP